MTTTFRYARMFRFWPAIGLLAIPVGATTHFLAARPAGAGVSAPVPERRLATVTQATLAAAIADGRAAILRTPGNGYTIRLPAGTFDLSGITGTTGGASIDLSRIQACPGQFTIAGAGADKTTIITDDRLIGIMGRETSCVTISDLTMSRKRIETTQGTVVAATPDSVTLDIPRGFPSPDSLMPAESTIGRNGREVVRRWLKRYTPSPTGPQIVVDQQQAAWEDAVRLPGATNRWRFDLVVRGVMPSYRPGDMLGVKSKSGFDAYRFVDGQKITLRGVRWMMETRGVFRNVNNVTIQNCSIVRPAPINGVRFAMASSSGGPQIGQPSDPMTQGHVVTGNDFSATGDDALLFAHANGVVRDNRFSDTFGNAIRIYESPGLVVGDNITVRAPIMRVADNVLERPGPDAAPRRGPPRGDDRNDPD